MCVLVAITLAIISYMFWSLLNYRKNNLPPGPRGLPLLGNVLGLDLTRIETYRQLRKRYGDLVTIRLGTSTVILVNGYDTIVDALVKHADVFSDRPKGFINSVLFDHSSKYEW